MEWIVSGVLGVVALVLAYFLGRAAVVWWYQERAQALDEIGLVSKLLGLQRFGADGSYLVLRPVDSPAEIRVTKRSEGERPARLEFEVGGMRIESAQIAEATRKLAGLAGERIRLEEGALTGVLTDFESLAPEMLERVVHELARACGFTARQKFRFEFEGPNDPEAVQAFFGRAGS